MRRKEKEITDRKDIEQIIKKSQVCRLGMFDGKIPYIVPMNFGYRDNILYFHSALSGRKIDILKKNPDACFEIDIPGEVINSDKTCSWSMNYRSLMGEGKVILINDEDEKAEALNIIMEHYSGKTDWDINMKMLENTSVFIVKIDNISAKRSGGITKDPIWYFLVVIFPFQVYNRRIRSNMVYKKFINLVTQKTTRIPMSGFLNFCSSYLLFP